MRQPAEQEPRRIAYRQWSSAEQFSAGTFDGTTLAGGALTIDAPTGTLDYCDPYGDGSTRQYDVATWTSPEVLPGFGLTELVTSWNARTPAGTWVQLAVSGTTEAGERSRTHILGRWAEHLATIHRTSVPEQDDHVAGVTVDTLVTGPGRSLVSWQLTVSLLRLAGSTATPVVSLVGAMASRLPTTRASTAAASLGGASATTLDVPTYSQEVHVGEYPQYNGGGEAWCSPTSTAMVLAYWQRVTGDPSYGPNLEDLAWVEPSYPDRQVDHAAAGTYDWSYDGTGNWPFNTAYAGVYGLESFVTRLRSLAEVERFIAAGIPLVASLSFTKDELTGAGYGTTGHLVVIVGFTDSGDVVVNDPASHLAPSNDEVRTVYDRGEFEQVWLSGSGGIVYVIRPPSVALPAPGATDEPNW